MNKERFKAILDKIKADPASWYQEAWHCGTAHCFAGHAQIESGMPMSATWARRDARAWLDLSRQEADYLFAGGRTIKDFEVALKGKIFGPDGYDRDGYDRDGYDRDGYDRDGYDRDGYDRKGFNRKGFNRSGFNRSGYDRKGFNRDGYDLDGLDKNNQPRR